MAWKPRRKQWNWRKFLSTEERLTIQEAEDELAEIEAQRKAWDRRWARTRQLIVNRAIHRAKYAAGRASGDNSTHG
jgi:hypothetical protein